MLQHYFDDFRYLFPDTKYIEYPVFFTFLQTQISRDIEHIYNKWQDVLQTLQTQFKVSLPGEKVARFQYLLWKVAHYKINQTDFVRYCELHQNLADLEARYRVQGKLCVVLSQMNGGTAKM